MLAVEQHHALMRLAQALDHVIAVTREPELDFVVAVLRERVADPHPVARDEPRATRWLKRIGAEEGKFICVLPRLRYTPYYQVKNLPRDESDYALNAINAKHAAQDQAPLRDLITLYVRETGHKVLLCPEMTCEIAVAREHLLDPLPVDVKPHVIWRDTFWLADEAASVYARATAIVSAECHSPIIALSQGTPAFYVRNPADTVKAQMFADIGMGDWIFESGHTTGQQPWEKLKLLHEDRTAGPPACRSP